jgi:plastocyanin
MLFTSAVLAAASLATFASAADHQVVVGGAAGLVYTPSNITAAVGDTVTFLFETRNHTATQSGFADPCNLLVNATTGATGFDSGFVPVAANATQIPAWTVEVLVLTPIWVFCRQGNHCQQGMVFSVNAATTGNKTFEAFRNNAMGSTGTTTPGGTTAISSGVGATAAGSLSSADAPSSTSTSADSATTTGAAAISRPAATWSLLGLGIVGLFML